MRSIIRWMSVVLLYLSLVVAITTPGWSYYQAKADFTGYWLAVKQRSRAAACLALPGIVGVVLTVKEEE